MATFWLLGYVFTQKLWRSSYLKAFQASAGSKWKKIQKTLLCHVSFFSKLVNKSQSICTCACLQLISDNLGERASLYHIVGEWQSVITRDITQFYKQMLYLLFVKTTWFGKQTLALTTGSHALWNCQGFYYVAGYCLWPMSCIITWSLEQILTSKTLKNFNSIWEATHNWHSVLCWCKHVNFYVKSDSWGWLLSC